MLKIRYEKSFKKDLKKILKRGYDHTKLDNVIKSLVKKQPLPPKYHDHALSGKYKNFRDCHIEPDWILIYKIDHNELILILSRTGSHSDLF